LTSGSSEKADESVRFTATVQGEQNSTTVNRG
jgi:hypothetical protein